MEIYHHLSHVRSEVERPRECLELLLELFVALPEGNEAKREARKVKNGAWALSKRR